MFEGFLMEHLNDIKDDDEYICQFACKRVPGCKYYIYDTSYKDRRLFEDSQRQCDLIRVIAGDGGKPFDEKCVPG